MLKYWIDFLDFLFIIKGKYRKLKNKTHMFLAYKLYQYAKHRKKVSFFLNFLMSIMIGRKSSLSNDVIASINYEQYTHLKYKNLFTRSFFYSHRFIDATARGDKELLTDLKDMADQLNMVVQQIRENGRIPLLAPLHMCSDSFSALLTSMVEPRHTTVVSVYTDDDFGLERFGSWKNMGYIIEQVDPNSQGIKLLKTLKLTKQNKTNIVIFPDALPQCTIYASGKEMKTKKGFIKGKEAKLHSGFDMIAEKLDAQAVYFYLYREDGRIKIRIFPKVESKDVSSVTFTYLELALSERPHEWLQWHNLSLFYYNAKK